MNSLEEKDNEICKLTSILKTNECQINNLKLKEESYKQQILKIESRHEKDAISMKHQLEENFRLKTDAMNTQMKWFEENHKKIQNKIHEVMNANMEYVKEQQIIKSKQHATFFDEKMTITTEKNTIEKNTI